MFHESLAATLDMAVLPGVLGCRLLRRTVQVRLGTNTLRLPGGTPIFMVSLHQFMKHPGSIIPKTPTVCPRWAPSGKMGVEVGAKKKSLSCLQLKDCTQFTLSLRIIDPSHVRVACTRLAPGQVFWLSDHPTCRAFPSRSNVTVAEPDYFMNHLLRPRI